jgi:hypothetical protein
MFVAGAIDAVAAERREEFLTRLEETARPALVRDGDWFADYRRLRVVAVRT